MIPAFKKGHPLRKTILQERPQHQSEQAKKILQAGEGVEQDKLKLWIN